METSIYYSDYEAFRHFVEQKEEGFMVVAYRNCGGYPGMVQAILLDFDTHRSVYHLQLEWMSLGLDFYGDTLQEYYIYRFDKLEPLLDYMKKKYGIAVTAIPIKFQIDPKEFPNPLDDSNKKPVFEIAWKQFREDFKKGLFLDSSLVLESSSDTVK